MYARHPQGGWTLPGIFIRRYVDWRAGQIPDAVDKLRFLRRSSHLLEGSRLWSRRGAGFVLAALLFVLAPISTITKATSLWRQPPPVPPVTLPQSVGKRPLPEPAKVWLVEKKDDFEVYSNGLRIETRGAEYHSPRRYYLYPRNRPEAWGRSDSLALARTTPAGIVFHTTESDLVPFDEDQNQKLRRLGQGVLGYVRMKKAYHYLIDRFGRVYRTVEESSIANHAGFSTWSNEDHVYVNLNQSFLGVSFEAQTRPQDSTETINEAQLHAGRTLTDMLRSKYGITAPNCTTHAQVSVNPDNFRIGAHTDWAVRFPWSEMGLPDNYAIPVPSIVLFGFTFDSTYISVSEARLWKGLLLAQEEVRQAASARGMKPGAYRSLLNRNFKQIMDAPLPEQRKAAAPQAREKETTL